MAQPAQPSPAGVLGWFCVCWRAAHIRLWIQHCWHRLHPQCSLPCSPLVPGVARNFVSRALLEATSIDQALHIIGQTGQVQGLV